MFISIPSNLINSLTTKHPIDIKDTQTKHTYLAHHIRPNPGEPDTNQGYLLHRAVNGRFIVIVLYKNRMFPAESNDWVARTYTILKDVTDQVQLHLTLTNTQIGEHK